MNTLLLRSVNIYGAYNLLANTAAHVIDLVKVRHYVEYTTPPSGFSTLTATILHGTMSSLVCHRCADVRYFSNISQQWVITEH